MTSRKRPPYKRPVILGTGKYRFSVDNGKEDGERINGRQHEKRMVPKKVLNREKQIWKKIQKKRKRVRVW